MYRTFGDIPERFIRQIWKDQRLIADNLHTADGRPIMVVSPGSENPDSGPDFIGALVKIGPATYRGDIEIHRTLSDWARHRHDRDPRYNGVILHVALDGAPDLHPTIAQSGRLLPVLLLKPFLDDPGPDFLTRMSEEQMSGNPFSIPCRSVNQHVPAPLVRGWLGSLARERMELKIRTFSERLTFLARERQRCVDDSDAGYFHMPDHGCPEDVPLPRDNPTRRELSHVDLWNQLYYEGVLEGLGYSRNRLAFLRLARSLSLSTIRRLRLHRSETSLEAVLFGTAGLLPSIRRGSDPDSAGYVEALHNDWNRIRPELSSTILQPADWVYFPIRPANCPTRRIIAARAVVFKLLNQQLFLSTIRCFRDPIAGRNSWKQLHRLLAVEPGEYWQHHYDFGVPARHPCGVLGTSRIDDIIANIVLPLVLLYARTFLDRDVRRAAFRTYMSGRRVNSNRITRMMEMQLLRKKIQINSLAHEQGLLQLFGYYCTQARCSECVVGQFLFRKDAEIPVG